ncbi:WD repeat-containing protein 19 [Hondaea fermentalgiana]|uniref:WD repeat-containing protein 19 n=1 Tax=Hondaea fermentalgiana TaxID=2315210 RepID=A0A2R5GN69_9STRA|nr:WD repeat-containing protein 19 [Hondaea fermentalgiana]|eukprot:GBG32352.1 WD repeat-containing protein 19 [Hondaea fermentalgiana]
MKPLFELDEGCHGHGPVQSCWQHDGSYLASCGLNGLVQIYDRHGQQHDELRLPSKARVLSIDWDRDGELLAILQEKATSVSLYSVHKRKLTSLEANLKIPQFLAWSRLGPQLVIGTGNGSVVMYRKDTLRQESLVGKHSGPIVSGVWSAHENLFALAGEDKTISISTADGTTEAQFSLRGIPGRIAFAPPQGVKDSLGPVASSESKQRDGAAGSSAWTLCASVKSEMLVLYSMHGTPAELPFAQRYGKLVAFEWLSNRIIVAGFTTGQVVAVRVDTGMFGEEIFSSRLHRTSLTNLVVSRTLQRIASCGDSSVHVIDTESWRENTEEKINLENEEGNLARMSWTLDGQILTVATKTGRLYNFLTKMPMVNDSYGVNVAYLSSLREIAIVDALDAQRGVRSSPIRVPTSVEPAFVALGGEHVVVGMNNRAWFYRFQNNEDPNQTDVLVNEVEYLASVDKICLNDQFSAALCGGRIHLQPIEASNEVENQVFPAPECGEATCMAMTPSFLIYATTDGTLQFFSLADGQAIAPSELRHAHPIRAIYPNAAGTRIVFIDQTGSGFLYNPIDSQVCEVPDLNADTVRIIWDGLDPFVFVASTSHELSTYTYSPLTINGPEVTKVGPLEVQESGDVITEPLSTQLPSGFVALTSFAGIVTCQMPNAQLNRVMLGSHEALHSMEHTSESNRAKFEQSLALRKLQEAWHMALLLESRPMWLALSGRAMEEMNIDMAIRVWRQLGDAGMVMALERIKFVEDKHLLAGHIAALFGDYSQAQELYLLSSAPNTALVMRKDLMHWEQALKIAETVAPHEIPHISVEYAKQLEFKGEYRQALQVFESAMQGLLASPETQDADDAEEMYGSNPALDGDAREEDSGEAAAATKKKLCAAGIARMTLRAGNIPKGVALALDLDDPVVSRECAEILVASKQFPDAATLFEKAGEFEEAASIYIKAKNYSAAQPLLDQVTAPRLHLQLAKAKEAEKDFRTAAEEYEKGKDIDSVIRLSLEHLRQPEKAFTLVRKHQTPVGAELAARYCQSVNDFQGAIEFLLMAKRAEDAFELATAHDTMEVFESALGGDGTPEQYSSIAKYYETKQQWSKAAEFYGVCGQHHKALKLYLQCNELERATEVVGRARSDMLTHALIDYLMGETNGVVQDPVHIFRLYMALGNYPQAARTAMVIAHQERENGNYKSAHKTLYETYRELEARGIRVPQSLRSAFLLLHSYLLVKKRIKVDDHAGAARLLVRVAKSISKFPAHTVPILTSAVIECHRGGLKKTAFEYASRLMQPEHRAELAGNYRTRIEAIVRRRGRSELADAEQGRSECPYTSEMIPDYDLTCPRTKNHIPFCVVTGRHMVADDWCVCPVSKMPALYSEYVKYLESVKTPEERVDPVCGEPVSVVELRRLENPKSYLDMFSSSLGEEDDDEEDDDTEEDNANDIQGRLSKASRASGNDMGGDGEE